MAPAGKVITVPDDDYEIRDSNEDPRPRNARNNFQVDDVGFTDLKEQLDRANRERDEARRAKEDERTAREAAEGRARQSAVEAETARKDADAARTEGTQNQRSVIQSGIAAKKSLLDSLQTELETAFEAGDHKKQAATQRRLSEEAAELKQLEAGLIALGEDDTTTRRSGRVERQEDKPTAPSRQKTGDPFEDYVRQFSAETQQWLRRHPECVTNKTKNSQVIAAHNEATDRGYSQGSDAYWAYIERKMGYKEDAARRAVEMDMGGRGDNDDDNNDRGRGRDRDDDRGDSGRGGSRMVSARVSRSGNGGRSTDVHLTQGEVLAANDGSVVWNEGNIDHRGVVIRGEKRDRNGNIIQQADPRLGAPVGEYEYARRKKMMHAEGRYIVPTAD
jgi:hypothetical protein